MAFIYYEYISFVTPWQNVLVKDIEQPPTLLEEYHLRNKSERSPSIYLHGHGLTENGHFPEEKEVYL